MKKLPDSPGSSMQRLRSVLQKALLDGFRSKLKDLKQASLSEEIVNAILLELETWLVDFQSETIDQVSGRLETKLSEMLDDVSGSKESKTAISRLDDGEIETIRTTLESAAGADDTDFVDAVCQILNGVGKDERLEDFAKFISENLNSGKKTRKQKKQQKKSRKLVKKLLKKGLKTGNLDRFFEIILSIDNIVNGTISSFKKRIRGQLHVFKNLQETAEATAKRITRANEAFKALNASVYALAKSCRTLAAAQLRLAIANMRLAMARIALAASNMVLSAAILVYAAAILMYSAAVTVKAATEMLLALVIAAVYSVVVLAVAVFSAVAMAVFLACLALIFGFVALLTATMVVSAALMAFSAVAVLAAALASLALVTLATLVFAAAMIAAVTVLAVAALIAALAVSVSVSAAILLVGGVLGTALLALAAETALLIWTIYILAKSLFNIQAAVLVGFSMLALAIVFVAGAFTMASAVAAAASLVLAIANFGILIAAAELTISVLSGLIVASFLFIGFLIWILTFNVIKVLEDWWSESGSKLFAGIFKWCKKIYKAISGVLHEWFDNSPNSLDKRISRAFEGIKTDGLFKWIDSKIKELPAGSALQVLADNVIKICDCVDTNRVVIDIQLHKAADVARDGEQIKAVHESVKDAVRKATEYVAMAEQVVAGYEGFTEYLAEDSILRDAVDVTAKTGDAVSYAWKFQKDVFSGDKTITGDLKGKAKERADAAQKRQQEAQARLMLRDAARRRNLILLTQRLNEGLSPEDAIDWNFIEKNRKYLTSGDKGYSSKSIGSQAHLNMMHQMGQYGDIKNVFEYNKKLEEGSDSKFMELHNKIDRRLDYMKAVFVVAVEKVQEEAPADAAACVGVEMEKIQKWRKDNKPVYSNSYHTTYGSKNGK